MSVIRKKPKVWISSNSLDRIRSLYTEFLPNEVGGVLLGYWLRGEGQIVIEDVTGPGPNAKHCRNRYSPDHEHDQKLIDEKYKESERKITYLGDWHTHPFSSPGLSHLDKTTLKKICSTSSARVSEPLMLIWGVEDHSETFRVHMVWKKSWGPIHCWCFEELRPYIFDKE